MIEANPLQWPQGWPRTKRPTRARFKTGLASARIGVINELRLLGAKNVIINSDMQLRQDGLPYASQKRVSDVGIAVYFKLNGQDQCIPCDKWDRLEDNLHAINMTVSALRGLERWGAKEMVNAAFRGFQALPDFSTEYDYFAGCDTLDKVRHRFKKLSKELHPDVGGTNEQFAMMNKQYQRRMKELS